MLLGFVCMCVFVCVYSLYAYMSTGKSLAGSVIASAFVLISEKNFPSGT